MQDLHRRRGYRYQLIRALVGAGGIVLLGVVAYFLTQGAWHMYGKFTQAAAAEEAARARLEALKREEARAKEGVQSLGTNRGLEAEVRDRYGLARPGEASIVVIRPGDEEEMARQEPGVWERLWHAIFPW